MTLLGWALAARADIGSLFMEDHTYVQLSPGLLALDPVAGAGWRGGAEAGVYHPMPNGTGLSVGLGFDYQNFGPGPAQAARDRGAVDAVLRAGPGQLAFGYVTARLGAGLQRREEETRPALRTALGLGAALGLGQGYAGLEARAGWYAGAPRSRPGLELDLHVGVGF